MSHVFISNTMFHLSALCIIHLFISLAFCFNVGYASEQMAECSKVFKSKVFLSIILVF